LLFDVWFPSRNNRGHLFSVSVFSLKFQILNLRFREYRGHSFFPPHKSKFKKLRSPN
jgi:hypothetical protein